MIHILEEAAEELRAAADWYDAERSGLGDDLLIEADRVLVAIQEAPTTWPLAPESRVARRLMFKRFPYFAYYLVRDNDIWVVAFVHTSRRPDYWLHRMKH